jgi:hypothetical protein
MSRTILNSAFKVQATEVNSVTGIKPEKGAILFAEDANGLVYGDGFNWVLFEPSVSKAALATRLETPVVTPLLADTEALAPLYDTIVYNRNGGFTPALGNQVTINEDMTFDFTADFALSFTVPQVTILLHTYLDAVKVSTREYRSGQTGSPLQILAVGSIPVTSGQVLTLEAEANKACNMTTIYANMGLHKQI